MPSDQDLHLSPITGKLIRLPQVASTVHAPKADPKHESQSKSKHQSIPVMPPPPPYSFPIVWPGPPPYHSIFSHQRSSHPPWEYAPPSPYYPPILSHNNARTNWQVPYPPPRSAPLPTINEPQGGLSPYDHTRLSKRVSDNSYPNHPKPSGDHERSTTPKHTKHSPDPKHTKPPKHRSSRPRIDPKAVDPRKGKNEHRPEKARAERSATPKHAEYSPCSKHTKTPEHCSSRPGNDPRHVVTQKEKNGHRPEKARAQRLVCDFCKRGTPIWRDDGRNLCDGCYSYRQGRIAGR